MASKLYGLGLGSEPERRNTHCFGLRQGTDRGKYGIQCLGYAVVDVELGRDSARIRSSLMETTEWEFRLFGTLLVLSPSTATLVIKPLNTVPHTFKNPHSDIAMFKLKP